MLHGNTDEILQKKKKKENARGVTFGRIAMETLSPCNPVKAIPPPPQGGCWVLSSLSLQLATSLSTASPLLPSTLRRVAAGRDPSLERARCTPAVLAGRPCGVDLRLCPP